MNTSRPLVPEDLRRGGEKASLIRAVAARVVAYQSGPSGPNPGVEEFARRHWGSDRAVAAFVRAAVSPHSTTSPEVAALLAHTVAAFVGDLPASGAAQLFSRGVSLPLNRAYTIILPGITTAPVVGFVAEGAPIPVVTAALDGGQVLGPAKKLAVIAALTQNLQDASGEIAETVIRMVLQQAASKTLDTVLFDDQAASAIRPAGLRYGVVPIAGTAGGGQEALRKDLQAAVAAIVAAGGGVDIVVVVNTTRAASVPFLVPGGFPYPIISSPEISANTLIVLDAAGFVSGFGAGPDIDISRDAVVHFEDTTPLPISTPGRQPRSRRRPARYGRPMSTRYG